MRSADEIAESIRGAAEADDLRRVSRALDTSRRAPADVLLESTARDALARDDIARAADVLALMSDEERAKWADKVPEVRHIARQEDKLTEIAIAAILRKHGLAQ